MDNRNYWYNFKTGEHEYIETPENFSDYVPQIGGREAYEIYVEHLGMRPIDAAKKVLGLAIGETENNPA